MELSLLKKAARELAEQKDHIHRLWPFSVEHCKRWFQESTVFRESRKCERDRNKIVWSSFLGTGITERNKKSTVADCDCVCQCAFLEFFRQVVLQKSCSKVLR